MMNAAILFLVAVCTVGMPATPQPAAPQPPEIIGLRVGIADRYKVGLWTQVEIRLRGGEEIFNGEVAVLNVDSDGALGRMVSSQPCALSPGQEASVILFTRLGRVNGELTAELSVGEQVLARKTFYTAPQADKEHFLPALESQKLIVVFDEDDLGVSEMGKVLGLEPAARPVAAVVSEPGRLPPDDCGYEGVDAVILSTSRPEILKALAADAARLNALERWLQLGGRVVVFGGTAVGEVFSDDSPLRPLLPGKYQGTVRLRQSSALEVYCGSRNAIIRGDNETAALQAVKLSDVEGVVEAREADLPLVIRKAVGFGQILFTASALDRPPLSNWPDRPLLLAKLLDLPLTPSEEGTESAAMMHRGFHDMTGQLRAALERFSGISAVPFWLVVGLIACYILLIGPGDYFLLSRVIRRMQWTWVTFPLVVVLVGGVACYLDYRLKGSRLRVNQVNLVDVDVSGKHLRGVSWLNIFSPKTDLYNLSLRPWLPDGSPASEASCWFTWLGLPGEALGGMNPRAPTPALRHTPFRYSPDRREMREVLIPVRSTKSFTARWDAPCELVPAAELQQSDWQLTGRIQNTMRFPLRDCLLAYGRSVYELGTLQPGESISIGPMTRRTDLRTFLSGRKAVFTEGDKYQVEATPYDQSSVELPYIMRTMLFFEAAGGRRYTGLGNDYQHFVDLSDLLKAGRAILFAQSPLSGAEGFAGSELLRDGNPTPLLPNDVRLTFFRFIFPVQPGEDR